MSSAALLSCLGVEGWGPRHLLLTRHGEPEALLQRLQQAWQRAAEGTPDEPRAAHLLASLLRDQGDLLPLASPLLLPGSPELRFRHRLCCRPGERLPHLRSWECRPAAAHWQSCGAELKLETALLAAASLNLTRPRNGRADRPMVWVACRGPAVPLRVAEP